MILSVVASAFRPTAAAAERERAREREKERESARERERKREREREKDFSRNFSITERPGRQERYNDLEITTTMPS